MAIMSSIDAVTFFSDADPTIQTTSTRRKLSETEDVWVFNMHQLVEGQIVEGLPFEVSLGTEALRDAFGNSLVQALIDRRQQLDNATTAFGQSLISLLPPA